MITLSQLIAQVDHTDYSNDSALVRQTYEQLQDVSIAFTQFCLDSRHITDNDAFVLLKSHSSIVERSQQYAKQAAQKAAFILTEVDLLSSEQMDTDAMACPIVYVPHIRTVLGSLIQAQLQHDQSVRLPEVVAVTGTNGKTTISQLVAQLCQSAGKLSAVMGTAGNGKLGQLQQASHTTGDVLAVQTFLHQMGQEQVEVLSLEASSHGLHQQRLQGMPIKVAVYSNLSRDHLDYHADMADYAQAKAMLFSREYFPSLTHAIINLDDEFADVMLSAASQSGLEVWTYSIHANKKATFVAQQIRPSLDGVEIELVTDFGTIWLNSPLLGLFNVANLLAAIAASMAMGLPLQSMADWVQQLQGACGRMQRVPSVQGCFIVDYAHTPDALTQVLSSLKAHCEGELWAVFGCGGDRDRGKRPLMAQAGLTVADKVILTADNPRTEDPIQILQDMQVGITTEQQDNLQVIADRRSAIQTAVDLADTNDIVVIAGKGHETYQEINGVRHDFDDSQVLQQALQIKGWQDQTPEIQQPNTAQQGLYVWKQDNLLTATQSVSGYWIADTAEIQAQLAQLQATRIITDTRRLEQGDIFLALSGDNFDGHDFVQTAIEKGAVAAIVAKKTVMPPNLAIPQLLVSDTRLALGMLAAYRRQQHPNIKIIALTGSSGKTTCKEMLGSILQPLAPTLITRGNLNNDLGVPMMLLELSDHHRYAVLELGANHLGEIAYSSNLVMPDVACVLNVGTAHLGEFGGRDCIAKAKAEIYQSLTSDGTAVVPCDDDYHTLLQQAACKQTKQVLTFGMQGDVFATDICRDATMSDFVLHLNHTDQPHAHRCSSEQHTVHLPLVGEHNISNALAAAACASALGVKLTDIVTGLANTKTSHGRLHKIACAQHTLIDDTYNANPHSVRAAAQVLASQSGVKILLLGDIAELGESSVDEHYQLGQSIAKADIDALFCVGEFACHTVAGATAQGMARVHAFKNKDELLANLGKWLGEYLDTQPQPVCTILLKGSRSMAMETLIPSLEQKLKSLQAD